MELLNLENKKIYCFRRVHYNILVQITIICCPIQYGDFYNFGNEIRFLVFLIWPNPFFDVGRLWSGVTVCRISP